MPNPALNLLRLLNYMWTLRQPLCEIKDRCNPGIVMDMVLNGYRPVGSSRSSSSSSSSGGGGSNSSNSSRSSSSRSSSGSSNILKIVAAVSVGLII